MSDWQKGDLALCIKLGGWRRGGPYGPPFPAFIKAPKCGEVNLVRDVGVHDSGILVLWLDGYPGDGWGASFTARRFRKVTPPKDMKLEPVEIEVSA